MELLNKNKEWFLSAEGEKAFFALSSLEERTIFFYSYLKLVANSCFEKNNTLFKTAFFFADAVYNSEKRYSRYPFILRVEDNPFLNYLGNATTFHGETIMYAIFTAILQEKVNAFDLGEWIYDDALLNTEDLWDTLLERDQEYLPTNSFYMVDPKAYELKEHDRFLQLAIVWMFLK